MPLSMLNMILSDVAPPGDIIEKYVQAMGMKLCDIVTIGA